MLTFLLSKLHQFYSLDVTFLETFISEYIEMRKLDQQIYQMTYI